MIASTRRVCNCSAATLVLAVNFAQAQTTRGLLAGQIVDSRTLEPVHGAAVLYENQAIDLVNKVESGPDGRYAVPLLPPGFYRVRVSKAGYQTLETQRLELRVASEVKLDVRLRRLTDIWEKDVRRSIVFPDSSAVLTFYGPDVDTSRHSAFEPNPGQRGALHATVSEVIDPDTIRRLPFLGRDAYTMLVTLPGVTSETGTSRGLGLAINGQRPASSNFLLDGVSNNNQLVTGPLTALPPEAIQEYRVSITNFSAEYGGTSGYLANAITRGGGSSWHGIVYGNFRHSGLHANTFLNRIEGIRKPRLDEQQGGFHVGGSVASRVFVSGAVEGLRSRGELEQVAVRVRSPAFQLTGDRRSSEILREFPPPTEDPGDGVITDLTVSPPVSTDRYTSLGRMDYRSAEGQQQVLVRAALSRLSRPDFIWTPYEDFASGMEQPVANSMFGLTSLPGPRWANEFRVNWSYDDLRWDRAHPEIPTLVIEQTPQSAFDTIDDLSRTMILPGSPAFYAFRHRGRSVEARNNVTHIRDRHIMKAGVAFRHRAIAGTQTIGRDARYSFDTFLDFVASAPHSVSLALARNSLPAFIAPRYERDYRQRHTELFAEDTVRLGNRLVLNLGVRFERMGALVSSASLFAPANRWAGRFGLSYGFGKDANTLIRAGYGIFHDNSFDNLWQTTANNSVTVPTFTFDSTTPPLPCEDPTDRCGAVSGLNPVVDRARFAGKPYVDDVPRQVLLDPHLRSGYAQNFFLGVQRDLGPDWNLEVNGLGSLGRKLITSDIINRTAESAERLIYRGNQGASRYVALTAVGRYRNPWGLLRFNYTFGRTWDHQSDPLIGEFFDLTLTNYRLRTRPDRDLDAAFSMEGDNSADWASADFDQRHNFVVYSHWDVPPVLGASKLAQLFRNWRFAHIATFRSGFPFTVRSAATGTIINQRADLVAPDRALTDEPIPGGKRLLEASAFRAPARGQLGNSGRNSFRGPGSYNVDVSLSRLFRPQWLGEGRRIELRADVFNVLNHANLNQPDSLLGSETFGAALRGRLGANAGFPALIPLDETPRQIQLIVRFEF